MNPTHIKPLTFQQIVKSLFDALETILTSLNYSNARVVQAPFSDDGKDAQLIMNNGSLVSFELDNIKVIQNNSIAFDVIVTTCGSKAGELALSVLNSLPDILPPLSFSMRKNAAREQIQNKSFIAPNGKRVGAYTQTHALSAYITIEKVDMELSAKSLEVDYYANYFTNRSDSENIQ